MKNFPMETKSSSHLSVKLSSSSRKQIKKVFCKEIDSDEFYETKILINKSIFEEGISVDPEYNNNKKLHNAIQTFLKEKFGVNCEWYSFEFKKEHNKYAELFITFKKGRTL